VELGAACSVLAAPALAAPERDLPVLGTSAAAFFLQDSGTVLAVLAQAAVQLPGSVILPVASLSGLVPDGAVRIGRRRLRWRSRGSRIEARAVRRWTPSRVGAVRPRPERVRELQLAAGPCAVEVDALLGRGPGLTPSGDDVLAGYLLGSRAFGIDSAGVRREILAAAGRRTTALSASLLRHAADGWCIPQAAAVIAALGRAAPDPAAVRALLAVGSTSGAALGSGIAAAAMAAATVATGVPA
jgi:hypothetical protein